MVGRYRQFSRYVVVGAIGAAFELAAFSALSRMGLGLVTSNLLAFHGAFALCYSLHTVFTYRQRIDSANVYLAGLLKYALLMYAQLAVGTALLWLFIDRLGWLVEVAKFVQIAIVTPTSYLVQKSLIFKRGQH